MRVLRDLALLAGLLVVAYRAGVLDALVLLWWSIECELWYRVASWTAGV